MQRLKLKCFFRCIHTPILLKATIVSIPDSFYISYISYILFLLLLVLSEIHILFMFVRFWMCNWRQWMHLLMEQECVHTGVSAQGVCILDMSAEVRQELYPYFLTNISVYFYESWFSSLTESLKWIMWCTGGPGDEQKEGSLMVEFDDGDRGWISLPNIRLLPLGYQIYCKCAVCPEFKDRLIGKSLCKWKDTHLDENI